MQNKEIKVLKIKIIMDLNIFILNILLDKYKYHVNNQMFMLYQCHYQKFQVMQKILLIKKHFIMNILKIFNYIIRIIVQKIYQIINIKILEKIFISTYNNKYKYSDHNQIKSQE